MQITKRRKDSELLQKISGAKDLLQPPTQHTKLKIKGAGYQTFHLTTQSLPHPLKDQNF